MTITLKKSHPDYASIELEIMNSDTLHNLISKGKEKMTLEEILEDHHEEIEKERYLIMWEGREAGILDFTLLNPKDEKPWLGLLVIHLDYQKKGLGQKAYDLYEQMMRNKGLACVRLGCFVENQKGLSFWEKQGFSVYKEIEFEGRPMYCLEKLL